jgi:hypothetical protein
MGRGVTFRKVSDLDGQSLAQVRWGEHGPRDGFEGEACGIPPFAKSAKDGAPGNWFGDRA